MKYSRKEFSMKKLFAAFILAVMLFGEMTEAFTPVAYAAAKTVKVYLTVSDKGELAKASDGSPMVQRELTVKDEDGSITFADVLEAAHKKFKSESDFEISGGGLVTKLWGRSTDSNLFFKNNKGLTEGVASISVSDGDYLTAAVMSDDEQYSDVYTFFDINSKQVIPGKDITLTLKGHLGMGYHAEDMIDKPIPDATVKLPDGSVLGTTDENGKVTVHFDKEGRYLISAAGTAAGKITDYNLMGFGVNNTPPFGTMDFDTYESNVAYTEKDYGEGPYPANEVKFVDFMDEYEGDGDYDYTWQSLNYLKSNVLLKKDSPIIAPGCVITVKNTDSNENEPQKDDNTQKEITKLSLPTEATVAKGKTVTLKPVVTPANANTKGLKWTSSDSKVATVKNGVVKGVKTGKATVKVMTPDGKIHDECLVTVTDKPVKANIKNANISGLKPTLTYTGKSLTPSFTVKYGDKTLKKGRDYTVKYSANKKAGKAGVTITGKGDYTGSRKVTFTIEKAANTLNVKAKSGIKVSEAKLKKKAQKLTVSKLFTFKSKGKGKLTYTSVKDAHLSIDSKGKVTVKKNTPKGTYNITVKVKAAGDKNHKAVTKNVNLRISVAP